MPTEEEVQTADFKDFRVKHLLMTVGGNTLPNAIAGPLLVEDGGTITLIHSAATHPYAESFLTPVLEERTAGRNVTVRLADGHVEESHPGSIQDIVNREARHVSTGRLGLHYTGGTKSMSVHSFHTIADLEEKDTLFSYLDSKEKALVLETSEDFYAPKPIDRVKMSLDQMLRVHGGSFAPSETRAIWFEVAKTLAQVNYHKRAVGWLSWKKEAVRPWFTANERYASEEWHLRRDEEWHIRRDYVEQDLKSQTEISLYGLLNRDSLPIANALRKALGLSDTAIVLPLEAAADAFGGDHPRSAVYEWLNGKWLEHWALHQLQVITKEAGLHDVRINVEANFKNAAAAGLNGSPGFEIDVVAIRGYQLFVISCGTDPKQAKTKLFEAFTRARQMGGHEARVALLTTVEGDRADRLIQEASELLMPTGQIKVFGRRNLLNLPSLFKKWMTS